MAVNVLTLSLSFNTKVSSPLSQCIYVFCTVLKKVSISVYSIQRLVCLTEPLISLCGTNWIFVCYVK